MLLFLGHSTRNFDAKRLAARYDGVRERVAAASIYVVGDYLVFGLGLCSLIIVLLRYVAAELAGAPVDHAQNEYL